MRRWHLAVLELKSLVEIQETAMGENREYRRGDQVDRVWPSYPIVTLRIRECQLELSSPVSRHTVARRRHRKIIVKHPWLRFLASRFRFGHDQAGFAERVEIWTFRPSEVISGRQAMGYGGLL